MANIALGALAGKAGDIAQTTVGGLFGTINQAQADKNKWDRLLKQLDYEYTNARLQNAAQMYGHQTSTTNNLLTQQIARQNKLSDVEIADIETSARMHMQNVDIANSNKWKRTNMEMLEKAGLPSYLAFQKELSPAMFQVNYHGVVPVQTYKTHLF